VFDALTLTAVLDEVRPAILHGRVQRVLLLDEFSLGLEIYANHQRHQVVICAHPRDARLHLAGARLTADRERVTPFLLLLRKYVRGGLVMDITQPPLERTVALSIARRLPLDKAARGIASAAGAALESDGNTAPPDDAASDAADEPATYDVVVQLVIEIMGRHSNIVLVDGGGLIIDSIKRVPATVNRYRTVLPRRAYVAPPAQAKADPRLVDAAWWRRFLDQPPPSRPLATALVDELRGISPQVARDLAVRAAGRIDATIGDVAAADIEQAVAALMDRVARGNWAPHVYREDQRVVAFSPVPLVSLPSSQAEAVANMSAAVEAGMASGVAVSGHGQSRSQLEARLHAERARVVARRAALDEQLTAAAAADRWRVAGETIFAHLHALTPGQTQLEADGVQVDLDPTLSPVANAQRYFDRYRRARSAAAHLPELVAAADLDLAYVDQMIVFARQAETLADLQAIEAEWRARETPTPPTARSSAAPAPRRLRMVTGERVLIGRNGRQNDAVTFDLSGPDDLWLHARGLPGAHVILQPQPGRGEPARRLIEGAAQLAAWYSPARDATAVEVDITARRWVRKVRGGPPGLVTYRNESTLRVAPADEQALRARGLLAQE
jgi:predicted ribosome quality control (RQC) complex YloA/Tae2 family protein